MVISALKRNGGVGSMAEPRSGAVAIGDAVVDVAA
jgi:hypothetical protein